MSMIADHRISGPEFLRQMAERCEANGQSIEADIFNQRAREWERDKQALETGVSFSIETPVTPLAFIATPIEADFKTGRLILKPEGDWRIGAGQYQLTPVRD